MSDIINEAFNNIGPAARERVRIKTNIMDDQTLREKALELAVQKACRTDRIIDMANQFYEFLKGDECKPYGELSEGWHMRMNPSDKDIEIACEILNSARIRYIETQHTIENGKHLVNDCILSVCDHTLKISL